MFALASTSGGLLALAAILVLALTGTTLSDSIIAVAAVVALVGAFGSIAGARTIARQELTYDYVARFNSPELLAHWSRLSTFWNVDAPPLQLNSIRWARLSEAERASITTEWVGLPQEDREEVKLAQWHAMTSLEQAEMVVFMNFMEELAGAYNLKLLHPQSVKKHIWAVADARYRRGAWWINRTRIDRDSPRLLIEWSAMLDELTHVDEDRPALLAYIAGLWRR